MSAALSLIRAAREGGDIEDALMREYRFVYRIVEQGDFREGIRAAVIDKDRRPKWRHGAPDAVTQEEVAEMLAPLGEMELKLTEGSR
jgi:hypothetical protein